MSETNGFEKQDNKFRKYLLQGLIIITNVAIAGIALVFVKNRETEKAVIENESGLSSLAPEVEENFFQEETDSNSLPIEAEEAPGEMVSENAAEPAMDEASAPVPVPPVVSKTPDASATPSKDTTSSSTKKSSSKKSSSKKSGSSSSTKSS